MTRQIQECECGKNNWCHMPDSLAWFCTGCGRVIVGSGYKWEKGPSIQKWLNDIYPELPPLEDSDDK